MKNNMRNKTLSVVAAVATLILAGCAGQPQQLVVHQPDEQNVRIIAVYDTNQIPALRS